MPPSLTRHRNTFIQRLYRAYPALKRFPATIVLLILLWLYAIYYSERTIFRSHVASCDWRTWERWPQEAQPHHAVLVADPQLVDPHTYPGRPWPLSTLTERYTDRYMRRSYRLINAQLDPESIIFLGDLFDGGREWATERLTPRETLEKEPEQAPEPGTESHEVVKRDDGASARLARRAAAPKSQVQKARDEWYAARSGKRPQEPRRADRALSTAFVHGEDGRWKKWGHRQWTREYDRLGRIFFAPDQVYPSSPRHLLPESDVQPEPVNLENGSPGAKKTEYAIAGGKSRKLITSLPGNHDLGFGSGVQVIVRDRFSSHFGEPNRIDVIGNHTFVSIDAPSLAASSQFESKGDETLPHQAGKRKHIWSSAYEFLDALPEDSQRAINRTLHDLYPESNPRIRLRQTVKETQEEINPTPEPGETSGALLPIILLTHVPLYRDPNTPCGSLRERGDAISISGGYQYQNVLTRPLSTMIVQKVSAAGDIVHAFSGDDHDYCDVTHRYNIDNRPSSGKRGTFVKNIREVTVKSFSWAMGVRRPGFLLVSLWNPVDETGRSTGTPLPTVQTQLCLLPDQLSIFINYARLAALTLGILLARAVLLAFRPAPVDDKEGTADESSNMSLPRFTSGSAEEPNGTANGYSSSAGRSTQGRQRASSTGLKANANDSLGVQRSANARARSVSPAVGIGSAANSLHHYGMPAPSQPAPLIEKAGYYPRVTWHDPDDHSDDEESKAGDHGSDDHGDSQMKWRRRRRARTRLARVWDEFASGLALVAGICGCFYVVVIRTG